MHASARVKSIALWLLLGTIAAGVCSLTWTQAHYKDELVPVSMDSWYHAARILDTVADPAGFYEFDPKIHAPEGSLLPWPWGYDYLMASLVRAARAVGAPGSPIAILIWIPVAAVFLSVGLLMRIGRQLGLSTPFVVIAALCMALAPLTQYLHGVGTIDHHYAEYIFVLASISCGLAWFAAPHKTGLAIVLGLVLGAAPAIHNGLFILQVPVLLAMFVFWLQDVRLPANSTRVFCATLLLTTVAILLPSQPFREGRFEFYYLSWFHLYVAFGAAVTALALTSLARTRRNVAILVVIALVLLAPLLQQFIVARSFLAGTIKRLDSISEVRSVASLMITPWGRKDLGLMYSLLIWLLPATVVLCAVQCWRERTSARMFFWLWCVFGLALLATQLRLHYFGSFALYLPWLVLVHETARRWPERRKLVPLVTALVLLLVYWKPVRYELPGKMDIGGDPAFRTLRPILADLQKACAADPGIVLADNDAGHYIRYYTQCSVIANNFLLTRQHEEKIRQIDYLTSLPARDLPVRAPYVRYVLLRPVSIQRTADGARYVSYSQEHAQLISDLLLKPLEEVPTGYQLIEQMNIGSTAEVGSVPYLRLFKVARSAGSAGPDMASQKHAAK
jgi:hypothetical protein